VGGLLAGVPLKSNGFNWTAADDEDDKVESTRTNLGCSRMNSGRVDPTPLLQKAGEKVTSSKYHYIPYHGWHAMQCENRDESEGFLDDISSMGVATYGVFVVG
jgi:hypothetical protein